ncbi:MAG: hypothetical protein K9H48_20115 [Melioribacteraceae bacterium]|nr:hypothetical protein [Melioribacteraceae bacterium]MCF8396112.1 hypothetical protein [Melioribacteraceae bacterium]MCF8421089.1 hypothetical protein [Melioribacteraceae bacterium]
MHSISKIILLLFVWIFSSPINAQSVWFVDSEIGISGSGVSWGTAFKTIQEAINAAAPSNDDILVAYGSDGSSQTYSISSQLEINDKNLRITSAKSGTDNTYAAAQYDSSKVIITASGTNRLFYIHGNGVTNNTVIRGFKLTNGNASNDNNMGGAIYCGGAADPTISNNWITGNVAETSFSDGSGGGIAAEDVSPVITDNLIENNTARSGSNYSAGKGGGIWIQGGSAYISGNIIQNNIGRDGDSGNGFGGGIGTYNTSTTIINNTITNNIAGNAGSRAFGGGISITSNGTHNVSGNYISGNIANNGNTEGWGGGLYVDDGSGTVTVSDNIFYNNTAASNAGASADNNYGGGIYSIRGSITISSNIFNQNTTLSNTADAANNAFGGGVSLHYSSVVENNTFYKNANSSVVASGGAGSGVYSTYTPSSFVNNLFVGHNTTDRPYSDGVAVATSDQAGLSVTYCGFYNNGTDIGNFATNGGNNITSDPQFTDASNGDFTLLYNSPYIDAGSGDYTYDESTNHDYGWKKDIGAEEYSGTRVKKDVPGTGEILFGGKVRAKINVTTQGSLSALDITVNENANHSNAPNSVKRWFSITPTGSGATCDITLSYKDTELNSETEGELKLFRWTGSEWSSAISSTSSSTANNWLTCTGQSSFSDWVLDGDGALPVELASFTASVVNNEIHLEWETATEVNNFGFSVERTSVRSNEWREIGFVNGAGNSYSPKTYYFHEYISPDLNLKLAEPEPKRNNH